MSRLHGAPGGAEGLDPRRVVQIVAGGRGPGRGSDAGQRSDPGSGQDSGSGSGSGSDSDAGQGSGACAGPLAGSRPRPGTGPGTGPGSGPGSRLRFGSGYRVRGDAVLTAAHVVHGAASVELRFLTGEATGHDAVTRTGGEVVWEDARVDLAVVRVVPGADAEAPGPWDTGAAPVRYARITAPVACELLGFPRFKIRRETAPYDGTGTGSEPGTGTKSGTGSGFGTGTGSDSGSDSVTRPGNRPVVYRDSHHARGTTTPWAGLREGSLEISVPRPESDPEAGRSPWEGMSGGLVWSGGCVIGVVSRHHLPEGLGRLTAVPVELWYERLPPERVDQLHELIGLPGRIGGLVRLPSASGAEALPGAGTSGTGASGTTVPGTTASGSVPSGRAPEELLASAVTEQWRCEARRRGIQADERDLEVPLTVRFGCAGPDVTDTWTNIRGLLPREDAAPLPLDGDLDRIAEAFSSVPSRRLVVLGEAGAGKSILTLRFVLDMLRRRAAGDRVPVVFNVGSWDPADSLEDWMCGQLVRAHPALSSLAPGARDRQNLATALVREEKILPVLDGFDEIATGLHGRALRQLTMTAGPLLLTSRPEEYHGAVRSDGVLHKAAVVELKRLTVDDYEDYLLAGRAWGPVLDRLREEPHGAAAVRLAKALDTPLTVALARTVYSGAAGRRPEVLLDTEAFDSPEALQDHLLEAFVPAAYEPLALGLGAGGGRRRDVARAQRHLAHLAKHLDELSTSDHRAHDIAWWELGTTLRRSTRLLLIGLLAAVAFGVTTGVKNLPVDLVATDHSFRFAVERGVLTGVLHGLIAGLAFGFGYAMASRTSPAKPSRMRVEFFGRRARLRAAARAVAPRFALGAGAGFGVGTGLVLVDRTVVAALGYDDGLGGGPGSAMLLPVLLGAGAGTVLTVMAWAERPMNHRDFGRAADLLLSNRWNVLVHMLVWLLVFGIPGGVVVGIQYGPLYGFLGGLTFGMQAAFGGGLGYGLAFTAWGQWVALARVWLPLTGRLPWKVIAFLDDAHERQVLRRAGAVYQFRHARLQEHLLTVHRRQRGRP